MATNYNLKYLAYLFLAITFTVNIGCDDDEEVSPKITMADFEGTWKATSLVFTNNANSDETFEFVANGGESRFVVLPGGRTRNWLEIDTFYDEWDALVTLSGSTLTSIPEEEVRPIGVYEFKLDGNSLELTNVDATFDFTHMGNPAVSATASGIWERQ
jgi:hypothetical protein